MWTDLFLCKAQTWKVIMFTQGVVLRLKEGVELSSGNSFSKQPERTNPGGSSGIWLTAFIALPVGLLSPAWRRLGDCIGVSAPQVLPLAVCGCHGAAPGSLS